MIDLFRKTRVAPAAAATSSEPSYRLDPERRRAKQEMEASLARNSAEREDAARALAAAKEKQVAARASLDRAVSVLQAIGLETAKQRQAVDAEITAAEDELQRAADAGGDLAVQQSAARLAALQVRKSQLGHGPLMVEKGARQQVAERRQKEVDATSDAVDAAEHRILRAEQQAEMIQADMLHHELAESAARFVRLGRPGKRPSEVIHVPALHFYNAKHCFLALPRELERGGKLELSSFMVSVRLNADASVSQAPAAAAA